MAWAIVSVMSQLVAVKSSTVLFELKVAKKFNQVC